jgi:glyoxylase-like metal-dependent hydrolase (beta-lactamase superfamily II)
MFRFKIGTVTATLVEERVDESFFIRRFLPLCTEEALDANLDWMAPGHYDPVSGRMLLSMHSWLLDTGKHKILVDGCVGNGKDRPGRPAWCGLNTPWLDRLEAAGATPQDIDYVLCTHLHADHVGWNTRLVGDRWVPTFKNAKYVFSRQEQAYWEEQYARDASGPQVRAYEDSVLPVILAGQALVIDDHHELADCVTLELAAGHTPGHVAIWLKSGSAVGVLTGDILHHPIQVLYPSWSTSGCMDPHAAAQSRQRILVRTAAERALLLPGHFMPPHACHIRETAVGFAFEFVDP